MVIVADRYGECDRFSAMKSDHAVLNQWCPLCRFPHLQDQVMIQIKVVSRKHFRDFQCIRFLPFRQEECHLVSPAAIGRRVCRAGEIGLLSDGKVAHIMAFILYFFRGQKRVRIKRPAGYQKAHR